jgi:AcrR family transcriptional regulator
MGTKERKLREKAMREQEIVAKAKELFLAKGYEATTVDDIVNALELSKGVFYLHFASKEELFFRIQREGLEMLEKFFIQAMEKESLGLKKFGAIGTSYARFYGEYPDLRKIMNEPVAASKDPNPGPERKLMEQQSRRLFMLNVEAVSLGINDGSIRSGLDPVVTAAIIGFSMNGVLQGLDEIESNLGQMGYKSGDVFNAAMDLFGYALEPAATASTPAPSRENVTMNKIKGGKREPVTGRT